MKHTIVLLVFVILSESAKLPPNFKKCNRNQPDLKRCILEATKHGVTQLTRPYKNINMPNLNPLEIPSISVKAGTDVAVDQNLKNCKLYGFSNVNIDKFDLDFDEKTLQFNGSFPEIKSECDYEFDGEVLRLPVQGEGPSSTNLKNVRAYGVLHYEEVVKEDKTYFNFVSVDLDLDVEKITFNFENLFNGDKTLSSNLNKVLNDNWKAIYNDVKGDYVQLVEQIVIGLLNNFFSKVSVEEALEE